MKVLTIPSWYPTEDNKISGVFFKEQVESLKENGIDDVILYIHFISLKQVFSTKLKVGFSSNIENGIKVYRYNTFNFFPRLYNLFIKYYAFLMKKYIKKILEIERDFDIVHIHSAIYAAIAYDMCNIDLPYIITEHSTAYSMDEISNTIKKYLYSAFFKAREVIVVGKGLLEDVSVYRGNKSIKLIPNMVTLEKLDVDKDIKKTKFRFFSLGMLYNKKGMDVLIKAFKEKEEKFKNVELYIGGDGEEKQHLQSLIEELNLSDRVFLLGKLTREEVAFNMNNCDSFVLASRFETFGIVFIEALKFGKPIIGTKTGGPDTIINEISGKIVDINDIEGLANAMEYVYENIKVYDANEIIEYCENTFSKEVVCNKIISIYNQIIGE